MKATKKIIHHSLFTARYSLLSILLLLALLMGCEQPLPLIQSNSNTSLSDILKSEKIEQLSAPAQLFVSQGLYSDTIKIQWAKVYGATSYVLQRAVKSKDDPTLPEDEDFESFCASSVNLIDPSFITDTSYVDKIIEDPKYSSDEYQKVYYYRVCAENKIAGYTSSEFTNPSNISTYGKGYLLAPPKNVRATAGDSSDSVEITWEQIDKKDSQYNIYRTTDEGNYSAAKIATVYSNQRSYVDKISKQNQGVEYYYSIEAVSSNGENSVKSAAALGYALKDGAPKRVTGVTINSGHGETTSGIEIKWEAVTGAFYTVYRTSATDGAMMQIATGITEASYTDKKNLKPNTAYYYNVLAYKIDSETSETVKGPLSEPSDEGYLLSPPTNIAIKKSNGIYYMTFDAPIGVEKSRYNPDSLKSFRTDYDFKIYGGNTADNISNELDGITKIYYPYQENDKEIAAYLISNLTEYKFYKLQTVCGSEASADSEIAAPSPEPAKNVSATKAAYIEGYTEIDYTYSDASMTSSGGYDNDKNRFNANGVYPVKITWQAPTGGADGGYDIYRSAKPDSGFKKINDSPVKGLEYVDENESAKIGVYYYYKVLSLNSLEKGSNYSNTDFGYGAITHNDYMRQYNKTILASQKKLTYMNKKNDMDKLGSETISGTISGSLSYNAKTQGLGARITMHYQDYADFYIGGNESLGVYFKVTGDTNTTASMDASGQMDGTVVCEGMYPGTVGYGAIQIKGGGAGGGYYIITPAGFPSVNVDYKIDNM